MGQARNRKEEIKQLKTDAAARNTEVINENALTELLHRVAALAIAQDSNQDYNSTPLLSNAAQSIVRKYNLGEAHLQQLLIYREKFETRLANSYDCSFSKGATAFCQDLQGMLIEQNVPHTIRVISGLLDVIIGVVAMLSGEIEFA